MGSRTRKILDVLDSLARTTSLADSPNTSTTNDMSSTRKWLHDISVGRSIGGGPPRTSLRTPSRLYSIISNIRDKPYWKRPTEMAAAAATKKKEVSFEIDTEPVDSEAGAKRVNNSELPKTHKPVLKSYTGRNVAGPIKSNTFNANIVDLEADISSETTKKALESVQTPANLGKNLENGFLTKSRIFSFAKPIVRGPQAVLETSFEKEESSSDESSMDEDDDKSDKEIEIISAKAINSDTSTSSPENSKIQKAPSPVVAKQQTPIPITNAGDSWECSTCMVNNLASSDKCVCCETPKEGAANNSAAPASTFKATEFKPVATPGLFGFKPSAPSGVTAAPTPTPSLFPAAPTPAPSVVDAASTPASSLVVAALPSFGQQSNTFMPKTVDGNNSAPQDFSKPTSSTPFTFNGAASNLNSGGNQPATNGTFQLNGSTTNTSNLFNLPINNTSAVAPTFSAPAPSFPALGQQSNAFMPKAIDGNNSAPQDFSKPASSTPFTFNAAAPNFNFGGNQPAANGTFQFSSSNNTRNLFNLPINNTSAVAPTFSAPAPSFPTLGQQNTFMPMTGGSNSSNSRKLLLAKRKKR